MNANQNILVKLKEAGFRINDKWLVKGVTLQIEKGKIVTLIGPNGSGKSTTAKIALGIYKKIDGEVEKYTNKVGYVPQKISVDWTLPLRVNDFMTLTENLKAEAINEALSLTGVIHLKDKNLGELSGGEFQRVLLARAISKKPVQLLPGSVGRLWAGATHRRARPEMLATCKPGRVACPDARQKLGEHPRQPARRETSQGLSR